MSTVARVPLACDCGAETIAEVVTLGNADRRPDLLDRARRGWWNRFACAACGAGLQVLRASALVSFQHRFWVVCYPAWAEVHWRDLGADVEARFRRLAGVHRPLLGGDWKVRIVFGADALADKIVVWEAGLDEGLAEAAKRALVGGRPDRALAAMTVLSVGEDVEIGVSRGSGRERLRLARGTVEAMEPHDPFADPYWSWRRAVVVPRPADPIAFGLIGVADLFAGGAALRGNLDAERS